MVRDLEYDQPDFYHFSQDSLKLAGLALEFLPAHDRGQVLELGAGCGVVALEIARQSKYPLLLHLCERQHDYLECLNTNTARLSQLIPQMKFKIMLKPWEELSNQHRYDVIVCNPPYFKRESGRLNLDERENIARRWSDHEEDAFYELLLKIASEETLIVLSLRNLPPPFFLARTRILREEIFHERQAILTRGIVFALNIKADK